MKIVSDISKCIGAGQCVMYASELFMQDDSNGLVTVIKSNIESKEKELAERAVLSCPSLAIWLEDDDGNWIV